VLCGVCRNINWTAPEVLVDNGNEVCELADVWSLAVVAAEILSGEIPFDSPHCRQLTIEAFVEALGRDLRPELPPKTEDWMRDAVSDEQSKLLGLGGLRPERARC
jgi:serine/threonine protein kinase